MSDEYEVRFGTAEEARGDYDHDVAKQNQLDKGNQMNKMKGIARGVYPINTGKVSIGCMYIPTKPRYTTEAELFWQNLLLRKPKKPTSVSRICDCLKAFIRFFRRG